MILSCFFQIYSISLKTTEDTNYCVNYPLSQPKDYIIYTTDCLTISHTSPKYELSLIISAFALNKLFPRPNKPENVKRHFSKLPFINKGIDIIDLPSILRDFNVNQTIPPCFDNKEPPIISYSYKKNLLEVLF